MNRIILLTIFWSHSVSIGFAQAVSTPKVESSPAASAVTPPAAEAVPEEAKAIVLIIDSDTQQSEVVNQIVEALKNAGIATREAAETASPATSSISVTLGMRKEESYENIRHWRADWKRHRRPKSSLLMASTARHSAVTLLPNSASNLSRRTSRPALWPVSSKKSLTLRRKRRCASPCSERSQRGKACCGQS